MHELEKLKQRCSVIAQAFEDNKDESFMKLTLDEEIDAFRQAVDRFHDVPYKAFRDSIGAEDKNDPDSLIVSDTDLDYTIEYDLSDLYAFIESMSDLVLLNHHGSTYEYKIVNAKSIILQKLLIGHLVNYLDNLVLQRQKNATYEYPKDSGLAKLIIDNPNLAGSPENTVDGNTLLLTCASVLRTLNEVMITDRDDDQFTRVSPEPSLELGGLEGPAREMLLEVYTTHMSSRIGAHIISVKTFDAALAAGPEAFRGMTWATFLTSSEELAQYLDFLVQRNVPPAGDGEGDDDNALRSVVSRAIRTSAANASAFDHFRRMLVKDKFFRSVVVAPSVSIRYPLARVAVVSVETHGSCQVKNAAAYMSKDKTAQKHLAGAPTLLSDSVPPGLTVYYVTDVATDLTKALGNLHVIDTLGAFALEGVAAEAAESIADASGDISEKDLVGVFVSGIRRIMHEKTVDYSIKPSDYLNPARNKDPLRPRQLVYKQRASFLVKKYEQNEAFPRRSWGPLNESTVLNKVRLITSLKSGAEVLNVHTKFVESNTVLDLMKNSGAQAVVILDTSCKNLGVSLGALNNVTYNRILGEQIRAGKVIALAGGKSRKNSSSTRRRRAKRQGRFPGSRVRGGRRGRSCARTHRRRFGTLARCGDSG